MRIAIAMDHRQDAGDGEEERQQQLGDLETDKEPVQKQGQLSPSSSWRAAAAASIRESLSRSLSSLSHQQEEKDDDEVELRWAAVGRLPTMDRLHTSLQLHAGQRQVVDVRRLGAAERRMVVDALVANIHRDNLRLLRKQRQRMDRVGVRPPTVEVRWRDVRVEAECQVVHGKPLPTIWNAVVSGLSSVSTMVGLNRQREARVRILHGVSGVAKPSRLTLLLGPPGCGKTTLLKALAGKLRATGLKVTGEIEYNGVELNNGFVPEKTAAYIDQYDLHVPEMTVRETIDFSARFQGVGNRAEIMKEVIRREKEAGITPDPDVDTYMKAISVEGLERSMQTDYIMKIMGLDICADIMVGDAMRRGISGGEKKRLTTGEMIVGPSKALFMDEISTGLDSSTTFQIVSCLQQLAHISESTILVSLLQPTPETYELFDDIILMDEGKIVYHGPKSCIMGFFESCGFKCPDRKGAADFLQEVLSKKDQQQYWSHSEETYNFVTIDQLCDKFRVSQIGQNLAKEISKPCDKSEGLKNALSCSIYSLSKWELLKACSARELLLMKRNAFIYIGKSVQLALVAAITGTVFLRTHMGVDIVLANYYMGSLFYALLLLMVNGFPELSMAVIRLPVFYKQRDYYFYPAWAYAVPAFILKVPISLVESIVWTSLSYFLIGYTPEASRFFRHLLILFLIHTGALSMFRCVASYCQTMVASIVGGTMALLLILLFGGFIIPRSSMPNWLEWGFWLSPLSYAEIGLAETEFLAPRWLKLTASGVTLGRRVLLDRGLNFSVNFYWISIGALIGFIFLCNIGFAIGLTIKKPPGTSRAIISYDKLSRLNRRDQCVLVDTKDGINKQQENSSARSGTGRVVLPFVPLAVSFKDVNYYVDTPAEMREKGYMEKKLQLLHNITGAFQPGVLSALMGVTGAGKTTLLDVLAGRKTGGVIEGDIRVGGYPKVQETFARISGYCEQTDIHSPQITVGESVAYSAWLRLPTEIDSKTRDEFVNQVLETIELTEIRDALVGMPGINGLSTEQRKRLTIAVELVSNPSVIFMDEPTSGLDARAAAIVMRAVKNVANTGRTVVCTIHQPSIEIFEAFDELMLMKRGGQLIYAGPLGYRSSILIKYFQAIPGVPKIKDNYNPSTWMLEVTSTSLEAQLGLDFAQVYMDSSMYKEKDELVSRLSIPTLGSSNLHFPTRYPQKFREQFKACIWKQFLSYWRTPSYNLVRIVFILVASIAYGALYWQQGNINNIHEQQSLFNILGCMYGTTIFSGINNCQSVMPFVSIERSVVYRERFAGMYSPWAYSLAQVTMEIPYVLVQIVLFMLIAYPMIGYAWEAAKFFWLLYTMFCTLLYFLYLGMLMVSVTPNIQVASILTSLFYTIQNLMSGFIVPGPQIPKWWLWLYYTSPMSWTLNVFFTTQFGYEDQKKIDVFGETKSVAAFLKDYFGFKRELLPLSAIVLAAFPIFFAALFGYSISKLNFQRR
ncbi:ABC transporter G family member 41 isoform X2 [Zea mays]|uniref:ABC transporter G family member 37 n=4 Tax=Zea mays TaxID=4577 RepID=A0A1D6IT63_MAIZE|nr:ABC transporter G family member 41 isoform X2 [Zea mays]AQK39261.1 ABC transporter G family member 37 [Zea mays]|eukprot:XP_008662458.1 ABC transporter G family member 41 isoform X2 [Zea mays]